MRYKISIYLIFLMSLAIVIACGKKATPVEKPDVDLEESYHSRNDTAFVANVWMYFIEEPQYHLAKARESMINKDIDTSIYEMRRAAAFIQLEEIHAKSPSKDALTAARKRLEKLADDLEAGKQEPLKHVDKIFIKDLYVLARHYQLEAIQYWNVKSAIQTGYALKASVLDLEKADTWTEDKMAVKDFEMVQLVGELANKMIKGEHYSAAAVVQKIADLDKEIVKFGRRNALVTSQKS